MEETTVIIFMMFCMFFPSVLIFLDEKFSKDVKYVQTTKYVYVNEKNEKVKKPAKVKAQPKPKPKKESPIKQDALNCLVSLGMKNKDAKQKVDNMFLAKDYQTIESFLLDAYKLT